MLPSTGLVLGHRYTLSERIAIGGMGEVWTAQDAVLQRTVAVKILKAELLDAPEFVARFRAEARHAAALAHVGIASVYDYGEDATGAFLVMELVPGRPLSEVLAEQRIPPLTTTLSVLAQTAEALEAAHRGGVIHRDVKPGNILVLPDGSVKVTDFGIARAVDSVPVGGPLTAHGQVIGTPQYMSPEQVSGQPTTFATDVYSLGVIGYEMLAGHRPFVGDNPLTLALAHVSDMPPPLPATVPDGLRDVIERALSKQISDRPPSAAAFAAELRALQMQLTPAPAMPSGYDDVSGTATEVMSTAGVTDGAGSGTEIMPAAGVAVGAPLVVVDRAALDDGAPALTRRKRILVVSIIALVCIAAVAMAVRQDHSTRLSGLETASTTSVVGAPASEAPTTTVAPTVAPQPVPVTVGAVIVDPQTYIGLRRDDAITMLLALGLMVDEQTVKGGRTPGLVVDVQPNGSLAPGSTVTLSISAGKSKGKG